MRKRMLSVILALCTAMLLAGCGKVQEPPVVESQGIEQSQAQPGVDEGMNSDSNQAEDKGNAQQEENDDNGDSDAADVITEEVTFEALSKRRFDFSSGAGGWYEEFTIEKDGYFTGQYSDYDLGVTGESYPDGTVYRCSYSGHFTDLIKVSDYVYEMKLKDISYKVEPGEERLFDGMMEVYTGSYIFGENDTFTVYAPGMPVSELNEELYLWIRDYVTDETQLTMLVVADTKNNYAASSVERPAPYEDAKMTYDTYKESIDYYADKLANEAQTTMDMVLYSGKKYELCDEYLNYLWNLIRYNVPKETYDQLLEQQRTWIASKEEKANEIREEYGGGTFAPVDVNDTLAEMTLKRCEELIDYLR